MPRFLKEHRNIVIFAGLLFAQFVLISLQVPLGEEPSYFEKALFVCFSPIQRAVHGLVQGIEGLWNRYLYLRHVEAQNRELRDDLFRLTQKNLALESEVAGLKEARELANRVAELGHPYVIAAVIGRDASNLYKSILINRGARNGLRYQMPVVDKSGSLIGRVINPISPGEAMVQLITDDDSAVGVESATSKVQGILYGDAKGERCWFRYVLATNEQVAEGDELVTSGFDKIYPPGLRVGVISSVRTDGSLFKRIAVRPHLNFKEMRLVAVLTRNSDGGF
jgi:rod shape-determining protein MreC